MSLWTYFSKRDFTSIIKFFHSSTPVSKQDIDECLLMLEGRDLPNFFGKELILFLRREKRKVETDKLAEALQISPEAAREILINPVKRACFPIISEKERKLSHVYTIELSDSAAISINRNMDDLAYIISEASGKSFFMFFEDDFDGKSFMLAAFVSLISADETDGWVFTGGLDKSGNVISVDYIEEKEKLCRSSGKRLISPDMVKNIDELKYLFAQNIIDIPFSIAVKNSKTSSTPREAALENLNRLEKRMKEKWKVKLDLVKKVYDLKENDLVFYISNPYLPAKEWAGFIKLAFNKLRETIKKFNDRRVVVHLSFIAPAAFTFGFGAIIGPRLPFVAYHFVSGSLKEALSFRSKDIRLLKTPSEKRENLRCKKEGKGPCAAIAFYVASHELEGDVRKFMDEKCKHYSLTYCRLRQNQGNISIRNWTSCVREMYGVYNDSKKRKEIRKRMVFFSCPIILSFGLGVCMDTFENVEVFNFHENTYTKVFALSELKI